MYGKKTFLIFALVSITLAADFNGSSALEFTRKVVAHGPRPPGSAAHHRLQSFIMSQLKSRGCELIEDSFVAETPSGRLSMKNIIARFPGKSGRAIAVTGHYDTKAMPGIRFVGANDGGSSTGFLLEMARALGGRRLQDDVYLVWFDGEEAFGPWSATDGIYGSRHLAAKWAKDGTASRLKALINLDMIGDKDLGILQVENASQPLTRLVWQTARDLGYGHYFLGVSGYIEDDHVPFLRIGVPVANLIDFDYGPGNAYWHTVNDTMDKLSSQSFEIVGAVVLEVIAKLAYVSGLHALAGSAGSNFGPLSSQSSARNIRPFPIGPSSSFTVKSTRPLLTRPHTW